MALNRRSVTLFVLLAGLTALLSTLVSPSESRAQLRAVAYLERELKFRRLFEARLSLNLSYFPCQAAPTQGDEVPGARCRDQEEGKELDRSVLRRAAELKEADPYTSGLAYLLGAENSNDIDSAVGQLEESYSQNPKDITRANDLAVALIERAGRQNQPADLVAALEILAEALRSSQDKSCLLFNRALVLEKLQLLEMSCQAWKRYIKSEPDPVWVEDARLHLGKIESRIKIQDEPVTERLLKAAELGDVDQLRNLARRFPREVREFASGVGLRKWGEATLANRTDEAKLWLSDVQVLGEELSRLSGDRTALVATEVIESVRRRSEVRGRVLARAHQLYGLGHDLFQKRDYAQAESVLSGALAPLTEAGSPVAAWARLDLGAIESYNNQNEKAVLLLSSLLGDCNPVLYPALCGRTAWARGLALFRLGRLAEALSSYRIAEAAFVGARERDSHAGVLGLIAETFSELGDTASAWQYRYRGLRVLGGQARHHSIHNLLWEGGEAALEEGYPLAAEFFADEDVILFKNGTDRLLALESYLRRALFRRGRVPASIVLGDLEKAVEISHELPSSPLLPRIEAEVQLAHAELAAGNVSAEAEESVSGALYFFRYHKLILREAATLLLRARLRNAMGHVKDAYEDLRAAVQLFEEQRARLAKVPDQRLYTETWQGVYGELISLAAMRPDGAREALELLERSRVVGKPYRTTSMLNSPIIVLAYSVQSQDIYRFQLNRGILRLDKLAINRADLSVKIVKFINSLRSGRFSEPSAVELTRLLVPSGLTEGERICFVPDRELSGVPFASLPLPNGQDPLISQYDVVLANSVTDCAGAIPSFGEPAAGKDVLLVGPPTLDSLEFPQFVNLAAAEDEAVLLKKIYPKATLLTRDQVTVPALLKLFSMVRIFHFAGHSVAHPRDSARSFLPLARSHLWPQASLISAIDISKMNLSNLELVVLSACDTFEVRPQRADGVSGLVRAFQDAGAQVVVGTLWPIEDSASTTSPKFVPGLRAGYGVKRGFMLK